MGLGAARGDERRAGPAPRGGGRRDDTEGAQAREMRGIERTGGGRGFKASGNGRWSVVECVSYGSRDRHFAMPSRRHVINYTQTTVYLGTSTDQYLPPAGRNRRTPFATPSASGALGRRGPYGTDGLAHRR